jgi:hypothetical protein
MKNPPELPNTFEAEVTSRFGLLPNFFRSASRLARMLGGSLTAASPGINAGSTFTLRIPLTEGLRIVECQTADSLLTKPLTHESPSRL